MFLPDVPQIIQLHEHLIKDWKANGIQLSQKDFLRIVEENHAFNLQLWHAEDRARREDMGHTFVYHAKREIDICNQQRNNRVQEMDEWLIHMLKPASPETCPVNSETPGMMIDRLSILALKYHHMFEQTHREDVDQAHQKSCLKKAEQLKQQQEQLTQCLSILLVEVKTHQRTFGMYYQHKMYNDPSLNPEIYMQK